jgi:hypothetical protein
MPKTQLALSGASQIYWCVAGPPTMEPWTWQQIEKRFSILRDKCVEIDQA